MKYHPIENAARLRDFNPNKSCVIRSWSRRAELNPENGSSCSLSNNNRSSITTTTNHTTHDLLGFLRQQNAQKNKYNFSHHSFHVCGQNKCVWCWRKTRCCCRCCGAEEQETSDATLDKPPHVLRRLMIMWMEYLQGRHLYAKDTTRRTPGHGLPSNDLGAGKNLQWVFFWQASIAVCSSEYCMNEQADNMRGVYMIWYVWEQGVGTKQVVRYRAQKSDQGNMVNTEHATYMNPSLSIYIVH